MNIRLYVTVSDEPVTAVQTADRVTDPSARIE